MKRNHAVTPTDKTPAWAGNDWRRTNPHWRYSPPRVSKCGRYVEVDACAAFGLVDPKDKQPREPRP